MFSQHFRLAGVGDLSLYQGDSSLLAWGWERGKVV